MSLRQKYEKILTAIGPAGALGAAVVLGSVAPAAANPDPATPTATAPVSERLAAIREAVSAIAGPAAEAAKSGDMRLAWGNWWRNWGWGWRAPWGNWGAYRPWGNWHNWRNWGNAWRNW